MKRLIDLLAAACGLVVLSPLMGIAALLIKLEDGGPVFYRQVRVGRNGRDFRIWKFRTMTVNADRIGPALTVGNDVRITRVGRWLRKFKIDEFPQLLNVLKREMSLVGPRPEVRKYVDCYNTEQQQVLKLTPGITDPASVEYYDENDLLDGQPDPERTYLDVVMPDKIRINLEYAARATAASDLWVIARTLLRVAGIGRRQPTEPVGSKG